MARPELGTKRICPTTGRKFYDLGRDPVVSPYSGEVVPTAALTPFASRSAPIAARKDPVADDDEADATGPELVSLDEVEAEETEKDTDTDTEGDDVIEPDADGESADDDTLVVDDEDDDTTDLVDVEDEDDD